MVDAVVGGLIAGAIVAAALFVKHGLEVDHDRWQQIQACAMNLNLAIGRVLLPMFVAENRALAREHGWDEANRAVLQALIELRLVSRGRSKRRREVRNLSFAIALRLQAALQIFRTNERELDDVDLRAITGPNRALQQLVFGSLDPELPGNPDEVDAAVAYLIEHGLTADEGWHKRGR